MKTLIIMAHPNLSQSRFNRAWQAALLQEDVTCHDLYAAYPDGKIDALKEQDLLKQHDRVVFQFPLYWYSTPPLLKQWQDVVLTRGFAHGSTGTYLHGKSFMLVLSAGSTEADYQPDGRKQHTMTEVLRPLEMTSQLCGMIFEEPFIAYGANEATDATVALSTKQMLKHVLGIHDDK